LTTLGALTPFTTLFNLGLDPERAFTTLSTFTPFATLFTGCSGRAFTTLSTFTTFTTLGALTTFTTLSTFTTFTTLGALTAFLRDCITCHHAKTCDSHY
jgi:hypothetical protein